MLNNGHSRGFTLLEVLIALAVVAIAVAAILHGIGTGATHTTDLQTRRLASWVAQNHLAELRLRRQWPAVQQTTGTTRMAGHTWRWRQTVSQTQAAGIRRVDVNVWPAAAGSAAGSAAARLSGFLLTPDAQAGR